MLIDNIMHFCDNEYTNANTGIRCSNCRHIGDCPGSCKNCLEEIHYPSRYPNGKKVYDCPNLINFYVCDYSYKYTTEIYYLLQKCQSLADLPQYNVLSLGCGACPDLMAFEAYIQNNQINKEVTYRGIDKNSLWAPIHNQIQNYDSDIITYTNLQHNEDVFEFLEHFAISETNVVVLQYIISALYTSMPHSNIDRLFDLVIENIILYRDTNKPFVVMINDVNSINMGRDMFIHLLEKIQATGLHGRVNKYYFDGRHIKNEKQRYGTKHDSSFAMPQQKVDEFQKYEPWQFCTSAQLLIEIE